MNKAKLRSIMVLHGETMRDLAEAIGISESSVRNKMNESGSEFKQGEIAKIQEHYGLTAEEVVTIFFS